MLTTVLLTATLLTAQPPAGARPEEAVARYGVNPLEKLYPQATVKEALESAIKAAEKGRSEYIAAHLLSPVFVDAEAARRSKAYLEAADADLRRQRQSERAGSDLPRDKRLPDDPAAFAAAVEAEAVARGFRKLASDIQARFAEDPNTVRELRRYLREGTITETGDSAKITLRDQGDRIVAFKKIGTRWYLENRQTEESKPVGAAP